MEITKYENQYKPKRYSPNGNGACMVVWRLEAEFRITKVTEKAVQVEGSYLWMGKKEKKFKVWVPKQYLIGDYIEVPDWFAKKNLGNWKQRTYFAPDEKTMTELRLNS